jgi:hypothetical protein
VTSRNERIEARVDGIRAGIRGLAGIVDENLRSILLLLTTDEEVASGVGLQDTQEAARAAMDASMAYLGLESPVARNLRWAMAMIRIEKDYERVQSLTTSLYGRVRGLAGSLVEDVLHAMVDAQRSLLGLHGILLELWDQRPSELQIPHYRLREARGRFGRALEAVEALAVEAMVRGEESAANLRELVLACRHQKRIASTLAGMPGELMALDAV